MTETASSLNHHITSDVAKLVTKHGGTDNGVVVDDYFTCYLGGVPDDGAIVHHTIMSNVRVFHYQVVRANSSACLAGSAPANGNRLAEAVIVAIDTQRVLTLIFQILWFSTDAPTGKEFIVISYACTTVYGNTVVKLVVVANDNIPVNYTEGTNDVIVS